MTAVNEMRNINGRFRVGSYQGCGFKKQHSPWNKGLTKEIDERIENIAKKQSKTRKKLFNEGKLKLNSGCFKNGRESATKGKTYGEAYGLEKTEKLKRKMSLIKKGKHYSLKTEFKKGQTPWNMGIKGSIKPNKTSFKRGQFAKEKHPFWITDRSLLKYPDDFDEKLKEQIRQRDKYTCQLGKDVNKNCGKEQIGNALDVHHIDYNKKNCQKENLITLCHNCHTKTNFNRAKWQRLFLGGI